MQNRIEYETLVQKALLNVIRDILADVATNGLPGEHHFYISFSTQKPGVQISERLKERFPETMTIVLQHRFWDMQLLADSFTVTLSFGGVAEKLLIPFAALQVFYDPVAAFEVAFNSSSPQEREEEAAAKPRDEDNGIVAFPPRQRGGEKDKAAKTPEALRPDSPLPQNFVTAFTESNKAEPVGRLEITAEEGEDPPQPADPTAKERENSASIVSLDAFRKK